MIDYDLQPTGKLKKLRILAMDSKYSVQDLTNAINTLTGQSYTYNGVLAWRKRLGWVCGPRGGARHTHGVADVITQSDKRHRIEIWAKDVDLSNQQLADLINNELGTDWKRKAIAKWRFKLLGHHQPQRNPHNHPRLKQARK